MSPDPFWSEHMTPSQAARLLGESRQNVNGRMKSGLYPSARDVDGRRGIPIKWVQDTLEMRGRDKGVKDGGA